MEDATRIERTQTASGATSVELDTSPRPVVATLPQVSRSAGKSAQVIRIVATGENLLSAALPDLSPARRAERRERLRWAFRAAVERALERRAQLFVIAGNLFASSTPENQDRAFVAHELARLREAGVSCVAVAGALDAGGDALDDEPYRLYESGAELRFFPQRDALQPALVVIDGVRVALAGLSARHAVKDHPLENVTVDDPDDALGRADVAILVLHAPVEGLLETAELAGMAPASSLAALPQKGRLVIAGGAQRFGKARIGEREVVAPGASERHSFDAPTKSAGFAWIELNTEGVTLVEHVRIEEQPRVEVEITTAQLFPDGEERDEAEEERYARAGVHLLPVLTPEEMLAAEAEGDDLVAPYIPPPPNAARERILARMSAALKRVCRPDTMTRAQLTGPLTRRQFHLLPLAETLRFGRREAFSFELDISALTTVEPAGEDAARGPASLDAEIHQIVGEYRARLRGDEREARADIDVAAGLLRSKLQTAIGTDREAAR
jgi:DNA repair exonuclease SbcCD nuclease subunit